MAGRYFTLSNTVDWLLYIVSFVFVLDISFEIDFAVCTGPRVSYLLSVVTTMLHGKQQQVDR